ncbi:sulfotransferase [Lutimonas halocynthiae]|nr:sulfotransferase [Lutimonas halocynthiae]
MNKTLLNLYLSIKHGMIVIQSYFRKSNYSSKVFCIGYNKTGTTSLGKSLELLGYRNSSFNRTIWRNYYAKGNTSEILKYASKFDSFDDLPWLKEDMIPVLDQTFPGSKFIYLERDEESWKKSMYNWRYKTFEEYPDLEESFNDYQRHKSFVMNYFKNRSKNDFLILDIKDKVGFKKLSEFLNKKVIRDDFPHFNKT